jgi:signal transduction histidine kinase
VLSTLSRKLSAVLLLLFCAIGGLFVAAMIMTTGLYNQEVSQRFNRSLAAHLAADRELIRDGRADEAAAAQVFHMLMVVNPSIELYLLDGEGRILSFSAPPGKVKRESVDLEPLRRFLSGDDNYPILGDDPRDRKGKKVFSAVELSDGVGGGGYLYVILGGEEYESAASLVQGSYILRMSLIVVGGSMLFALLAGVLLFHQLTRRLRVLADRMERFRRSGLAEAPGSLSGEGGDGGDEIDRLGRVFALMSDRIGEQIDALKQVDGARRELVSNVSHDLRTPLASLKGYLETLAMKEETLSAAERKDYLSTALQNTGELEKRVDDLLELSRLDSPDLRIRREEFPLDELAEALVQRFRLAADQRNVLIETLYSDRLPFVNADIELVKRVLENLVENALRCSAEGDRVTIFLEPGRDGVEVRVTDTGPGIRPADLPRIFEPHFKAQGERQAAGKAGLGLAIARKIVELHGSLLRVESEVGQGASFFFTLPSAGNVSGEQR